MTTLAKRFYAAARFHVTVDKTAVVKALRRAGFKVAKAHGNWLYAKSRDLTKCSQGKAHLTKLKSVVKASGAKLSSHDTGLMMLDSSRERRINKCPRK